MLQVRENKISLRRWSGATVELRIFEGTSVIFHHQIGVRGAFKMMMGQKTSKILMTDFAIVNAP